MEYGGIWKFFRHTQSLSSILDSLCLSHTPYSLWRTKIKACCSLSSKLSFETLAHFIFLCVAEFVNHVRRPQGMSNLQISKCATQFFLSIDFGHRGENGLCQIAPLTSSAKKTGVNLAAIIIDAREQERGKDSAAGCFVARK